MKNIIKTFINKEALSGIVLFFATILALIIANSSLGAYYLDFWKNHLGLSFGGKVLSLSLKSWIDDGLMAVFFLMIGLEIKREVLFGELSSIKKASLPIIAAIGGMVVPALIYFLFNTKAPLSSGFGIPMATDIAFALGVLMLLGKRVPIQLKIFLVSLAVVDDLGAVLVIALFYTKTLHFEYIYISFGIMVLLFILNRLNVKSLIPYLVLGVFLWLSVHDSGMHATIAGILLAIFIPVRPKLKDDSFVNTCKKSLDIFIKNKNSKPILAQEQEEALEDMIKVQAQVQSPMSKLEHSLHDFSAFIIMPLFAFSNAGFSINFSNIAYPSVISGIILGLVIGKPLGIIGFSLLAIKLKIAKLPTQITSLGLVGLGVLAGIGFTMSIFISQLAFDNSLMIANAKLAILLASFLAAVLGSLILLKAGKKVL